MRFVERLMRFHMRYYSTFLRVMRLRKLELKKKNFVTWLPTVGGGGEVQRSAKLRT